MRLEYALAMVAGMTLVGSGAGAVSLYEYSYRGAPMEVSQLDVEVVRDGELTMERLEPSRAGLLPFAGFALDLRIDERKLPSGSLLNANPVFQFGSPNYLDDPPMRAGLVDYVGIGDPAFDDTEIDFAAWISLTTGAAREVLDYEIGLARTLGESGDSGATIRPSGDSYLEKFDSVSRLPGLQGFAGGSAYVTWSSSVGGTWQVAPVPTPAGIGLMASGAAVLGFFGRFRRRG